MILILCHLKDFCLFKIMIVLYRRVLLLERGQSFSTEIRQEVWFTD